MHGWPPWTPRRPSRLRGTARSRTPPPWRPHTTHTHTKRVPVAAVSFPSFAFLWAKGGFKLFENLETQNRTEQKFQCPPILETHLKDLTCTPLPSQDVVYVVWGTASWVIVDDPIESLNCLDYCSKHNNSRFFRTLSQVKMKRETTLSTRWCILNCKHEHFNFETALIDCQSVHTLCARWAAMEHNELDAPCARCHG